MNATSLGLSRGVAGAAVCLALTAFATPSDAQRVSSGYEYFPRARLADPISGSEEFAIGARSWRFAAAFPARFANGRLMVRNSLTYKRTDFEYTNPPAATPGVEQVQSLEFSAFMIDSLSERWSIAAAVIPGLASDFEGSVSRDDFTFGAVLGLVRQMSETFQFGSGLAYVTDFGRPLPLPFFYLNWQITPRVNATGILPTDMAVVFTPSRRLDLGLSFAVDGTRYHGDPAKYGAANPRMRYSEGTISPSVGVHLTQWLHANIEGGYAFYRNFEFFDGNRKTFSLDMKPIGYWRAVVALGM